MADLYDDLWLEDESDPRYKRLVEIVKEQVVESLHLFDEQRGLKRREYALDRAERLLSDAAEKPAFTDETVNLMIRSAAAFDRYVTDREVPDG